MTMLTWPGQRNPSRRGPGSAIRIRSAGGTTLWTEKTERLAIPFWRAVRIIDATVGAVVSKPIPMKRTSRFPVRLRQGRCRPWPTRPPGCRPRRPAAAGDSPRPCRGPASCRRRWQRKTFPAGQIEGPVDVPDDVTQTGQPGPDIRRMPGGRSFRIPYRPIAWVWLPQTSMNVTGPADPPPHRGDALQQTPGEQGIPVLVKMLHGRGSLSTGQDSPARRPRR